MIDNRDRLLADADPARELYPTPSEELLARLLAQPRSARRAGSTRHARRLVIRPVIALAVVALVVTVVLVASPSGPVRTAGRGSLALAAQAYARTSAAPDEIVHTVATIERTETTATGRTFETGSIEEWHRGGETHRIERYYSADGHLTAALDHVIGADGVMRQVDEGGTYRIVRKTDNEDAANVIAQQQSGFVEEFRRLYERGQLDPGGTAQFAGRPAQRYVVSAEQNTPKTVVMNGRTVPAPTAVPRGPEQAFYIDRETGQPLGYTSTMQMSMGDGRGGAVPTTMRYVETVQTIEQLAPTPENLGKLHTFILPRRRDAEGCIRGPVTGARDSDTATKSDCGGTPGAPIDG
jgi:hypothetical protein